MKRLFTYLFCLFCVCTYSQENKATKSTMDVNYFAGNIALHNTDILHLIQGHPEGVIISWNKKTFGEEAWQQGFNYPDYGLSFAYQDLKNETLGNNVSVYAHYNFYFLKRNLMFRIGQGLAYTTNPYNKDANHKNVAFGSHILSSTYAMLNYKKERLLDRFGLQAGLSLIHYSNANVKAPNTSVNTIAFNFGVTYNLDEEDPEYITRESKEKFTQPIKYNLVFRSGINESDLIGSGQFPFYILSAYADKRLGFKSAVQLGTDVFFSNFLKEYIRYRAAAFPEEGEDGTADYKRVGVFVGHELFINKMSLVTQLGYYAYYPYHFEGRTYIRVGLKRYFGEKWFAALTLKSHGAKAEAVELGVGIRL
ncbi:acyloxyacyl hydrolase [Oceanihabitans sediminis]|uniref:Acyloxyacyl hydrolase n=1 Tax=Oceanihabitans sediminis TaxID=1812012 RepID=A0A368P791_9FLAO|nr:acyloxyacyl hydrolase [Oceanihabitans sediminis]MDX1772621.1 acyloxyacyl hydrolase [Oceanihabitans sediminis]RCU57974.1 acyloxyacyl hydrolase [Oceanihabitans sediminis]